MKIIKFLILILLISSCNKYLGTIDSDYNPVKEVTEVFKNNINQSNDTKISSLDQIKYPNKNKFLKDISSFELEKIVSLNKIIKVRFYNNQIYILNENSFLQLNYDNPKTKLSIKLNLDDDEKAIDIVKYLNEIIIITNKSKLLSFESDSLKVRSKFEKYINPNIVHIRDKILIFSVFGEVLEIDLATNIMKPKGNFAMNQGVLLSSNFYLFNNRINHLFNSSTLLTIDHEDLSLKNNYFLDDLNILSSLGTFQNLIDAPFQYQGYLYFIENNGLISVYNPISSEILWEMNINSVINDYNFNIKGELIILTNKNILIIDKRGILISQLNHEIKNPIKILNSHNELFIFSLEGITTFNLKDINQNIFKKNKFEGDIEVISYDSEFFIKDTKNLYKISE